MYLIQSPIQNPHSPPPPQRETVHYQENLLHLPMATLPNLYFSTKAYVVGTQ